MPAKSNHTILIDWHHRFELFRYEQSLDDCWVIELTSISAYITLISAPFWVSRVTGTSSSTFEVAPVLNLSMAKRQGMTLSAEHLILASKQVAISVQNPSVPGAWTQWHQKERFYHREAGFFDGIRTMPKYMQRQLAHRFAKWFVFRSRLDSLKSQNQRLWIFDESSFPTVCRIARAYDHV